MAVGPIVLYDQFPMMLAQSAYPDWDDPAAGAFMWVLAQAGYQPSISGVNTYGALVSFALTTGAGAPINVSGRQLVLAPNSNSKVAFKAASANFGAVPQAVKWLICVCPTTAGVIDNSAKLCFYVDLNNAGTSAELAANTSINLIATGDILGTLG